MKVQKRRYSFSKAVFLCILCTVIVGITWINYKYAHLISSHDNQTSTSQKFDIPIIKDYSNACFKARADSVAKTRYGKLNYPFINVGFPKIGSSSIHSFFGCAGYRSAHYRCSRTTRCSECIQQSVQEGLKPLHHCILAEVYSQIDDGRKDFPQIDYLEQLVESYPNATFLLAFRDMENWYKSLSRWTRNDTRMDHDLMKANIQGLPPGIGSNVDEFSSWFCNHVTRVREVVARHPSNTLVEIDLEDDETTRQLISDIFDVDPGCWGRSNANLDLHPELNSENTVTPEGQSKWFLLGNSRIKSKDGTMRKRNYPGEPFVSYP